MDFLAVKLVLTPLLIGAATLAARRWGNIIGGWIVGLPLTSGPISVFMALEQGQRFAAQSAISALLGLLGVGAFCLAYRLTLPGTRPWLAAAIGIAAFLAALFCLSFLTFGAMTAAGLVIIFLAAVLAMIKRVHVDIPSHSSPWWDIPLRMIVATVMVLAITGSAHLIGPEWSGLLSPFPVFSCVMTMFAHYDSGCKAGQLMLRGVVMGCFAAAAFFLVVALMLEGTGIWITYGLAVASAVVINGIVLLEIVRKIGRHNNRTFSL